VGANGVGKTCLLIATTERRFPTEEVPTVFDGYVWELETPLAARYIEWSFWDTIGPGHAMFDIYHG